MAEYREARAEKRSYKKLKGMLIEKGANGGHSVTHHYQDGSGFTMPRAHHFGPEDGADGTTHAHISEHLAKMGIMQGEAHEEQHAGPETVEQAASEPASEDVNA